MDIKTRGHFDRSRYSGTLSILFPQMSLPNNSAGRYLLSSFLAILCFKLLYTIAFLPNQPDPTQPNQSPMIAPGKILHENFFFSSSYQNDLGFDRMPFNFSMLKSPLSISVASIPRLVHRLEADERMGMNWRGEKDAVGFEVGY